MLCVVVLLPQIFVKDNKFLFNWDLAQKQNLLDIQTLTTMSIFCKHLFSKWKHCAAAAWLTCFARVGQSVCDLLFVYLVLGEGIDLATALSLSPRHIDALFTKIGDRSRFENNLSLYKQEQKMVSQWSSQSSKYFIQHIIVSKSVLPVPKRSERDKGREEGRDVLTTDHVNEEKYMFFCAEEI